MPDSIVKVLARRLAKVTAYSFPEAEEIDAAAFERTLRDMGVEELIAAGQAMRDTPPGEVVGIPARILYDRTLAKVRSGKGQAFL